jgi:glutathione S-transferase
MNSAAVRRADAIGCSAIGRGDGRISIEGDMANWKLVIGNKNYSSWSLRPWLMLRESGIAFDEVRVLLHRDNSREEIIKYSPSGRVPALITEEGTIWESLAIAEYLAERFPEKNLWPVDRARRAHARAVANEMHAGFSSLRSHMPADIRSRYPAKPVPAEVAADIERIQAIWSGCLAAYGGPLLFGRFTIADAMYAPVVTRFVTYGVTVSSACRQYMDTLLALPSFQQWIAEAKTEREVINY